MLKIWPVLVAIGGILIFSKIKDHSNDKVDAIKEEIKECEEKIDELEKEDKEKTQEAQKKEDINNLSAQELSDLASNNTTNARLDSLKTAGILRECD